MAHLFKKFYSRCCIGDNSKHNRMERSSGDDDGDCNCEDACHPIVDLNELLSATHRHEKLKWCDLVQPLVKRSTPRHPTRNFYSMDEGLYVSLDEEALKERPQVIVCHDYKGNYLDDRFLGAGTGNWSEFRFYNWNVVDVFIYFSHNLISIPTLQYLNAAHENGVKVIGTFIVENTDGREKLHEILKSREHAERVADSLVEISKRLKFEGYLLNVEVPVDSKHVHMLKHFIRYLTQRTHDEIPHGIIIWYDSVIYNGHLIWQNELNEKNEEFFHLCDGLFTNYNWSVDHLERSSRLIEQKYHHRRQDVYFGIDVFGRGQVAGFRTDETLSKSAAFKFSTAIFAPGWTCETINLNIGFEDLTVGSDAFKARFNEVFLARNDKLWSSLYHYLYLFGPKELPFNTSFCIGSGRKFYRMGKESREGWFNLKYQGFQPSTPSSAGHFTHHYEDAFNGGSCLSIETNELIKIFTSEFSTDEGIIFSYTFKCEHQRNDLQVALNITNAANHRELQIVCGNAEEESSTKVVPLSYHAVRDVNIHLASSGHLAIPTAINGWNTRFYLLKFQNDSLITDIGVKKIHTGRVLLGQMSFYSAKHLNIDEVRKIVV